MSAQDESLPSPASIRIGVARLIVGLVQGLALYLLYAAIDAKTWPATNGFAFAPLLFVLLFVPLLVAVSLGNLRLATLLIWTSAATVIVAGLAGCARWHTMQGRPDHYPDRWRSIRYS